MSADKLAGNRRCGSPKLLEAEQRTKPELDRSVILLDQLFAYFEDRTLLCLPRERSR
jgi:hypothetical protein